MPLTIEPPPQGAERVIDATMIELVSHGGLAVARSTTPTASTPLPVYHLGADAIAEQRGLDAAEHVGWLTTVRNGTEIMGSLEFAPSGRARRDAPPVQFTSFARGPLHRGIAQAVEVAAKHVQRRNVRARILRAPAVYLLALWLTDGNEDALMPIAPAPPPLEAGKMLPAAQALAALADAAKRAYAGDERRS
jgi:hypothetical protein